MRQGRDPRKGEPREVLKLLSQWTTAEQKRNATLKTFCSDLLKEEFSTLPMTQAAP